MRISTPPDEARPRFQLPPVQMSVVNLTRNVRFRNSQIHGVDAYMILTCAPTLVQRCTRPTLPAHVSAVNRQRCSVLTETNESKASRVSHSSYMTTANLANSRVDDCRPPSSLKNCASSAIAVAYTSRAALMTLSSADTSFDSVFSLCVVLPGRESPVHTHSCKQRAGALVRVRSAGRVYTSDGPVRLVHVACIIAIARHCGEQSSLALSGRA